MRSVVSVMLERSGCFEFGVIKRIWETDTDLIVMDFKGREDEIKT